MKAYEGKNCSPDMSAMLSAKDTSNSKKIDVFISYDENGNPQIPIDQMALQIDTDNEIVWASTQSFSVWFSDRTVRAPEKVSDKPKGYHYAVKLHARDFPHTNLSYEYTIDANGGQLDPSVIVKPQK